MTDISRHPILRRIYDACISVEKCGASEALTAAVTAVGALYKPAKELLDLIASLERQLEDAKADAAAVRELMNVYNLGGWTDMIEPMKRALAAEAQLAERTRERDDGIKLLADFHDSLCGNRHNESLEQVVERVDNYLDPHIALIRERRWADNANVAKEKARAESAERALAEARKDQGRYRWLRDTGDATWRPFGIREGYSAAQADAAIDSAIEAEKRG